MKIDKQVEDEKVHTFAQLSLINALTTLAIIFLYVGFVECHIMLIIFSL